MTLKSFLLRTAFFALAALATQAHAAPFKLIITDTQTPLVAPAAEAMEEVKRKFGGHLGFSGVKLVSGGPKWMDQIAAAAPTLLAEATHVIVHDAARPAVPGSFW